MRDAQYKEFKCRNGLNPALDQETSFSSVQTQTYNPEARELDFSCVQVSLTVVFLTKMLDFWKARPAFLCLCVCVCVCLSI